jgi:hypothetical protein
MFIQTEHTPNPATLKFIPGKTVLGDGTVDYRTKAEAAGSPLASRLFEVDGVTGVFLGSDFISVTKGDAEWPHIRPAILGAIMEHYLSGAPMMSGDSSDEESAEEDYDPKDEETVKTIKDLLDTRVRPAVANDGGDITFHGFRDGVVLDSCRKSIPVYIYGGCLNRMFSILGYSGGYHHTSTKRGNKWRGDLLRKRDACRPVRQSWRNTR